MENKKIFNLSEEDTLKIERVFHEISMHKAIIAELINTNPAMEVRDTRIYEELLDLQKEYSKVSSMLVNKYTDGKYDSDCKWQVKFAEQQLIITE